MKIPNEQKLNEALIKAYLKHIRKRSFNINTESDHFISGWNAAIEFIIKYQKR